MPTWAVILAGGRGTRFWPRSRRSRPKQVQAIGGPKSLLRATVDRITPLVPAERILVVTGVDMADAVRAELPEIPADRVLVEPHGRNTAPAIAWATAEIERRGGSTAIVLPSDHRIADEPAFRAILQSAVAAVQGTARIALVGITPDRPHTGFGYIEMGEDLGGMRRVVRFIEKPDLVTAQRLLAERPVLWNGGMFVYDTATMRAAIDRHLPATAAALRDLPHGIAQVWDRFDAIAIDRGVIEKADDLVVIPADVGWSDLGAWSAVAEVLPPNAIGVGSESMGIDSTGNVVDAPGKLVCAIGVSDLLIVDAGDVLLVARKDRADEVQRLVEELTRRGRTDLI